MGDRLLPVDEWMQRSFSLKSIQLRTQEALQQQKELLSSLNQKLGPDLKIVEIDWDIKKVFYQLVNKKASLRNMQKNLQSTLVQELGESALSLRYEEVDLTARP